MSTSTTSSRISLTQWLVLALAALGFMFDTYEILMMPLVAGQALGELVGAAPGSPEIRGWISLIFWSSTLSGGLFGLIGGYLTDRFGRRRVLTWSILLYAFSACGAAFSTNPWMLLVLRCTTFMGVCVEFVAAVAWLAELFPEPALREKVLGYTQVFASLGGIMVTMANTLAVKYAAELPEICGGHSSWRYTLLSGMIPAIPLIVVRPFLPESPTWSEKRRQGTLRRPSFGELFAPELRRVTVVSTLLCACAYATAYGAIQYTPSQIVPALPQVAPLTKPLKAKEAELQALVAEFKVLPANSPERAALGARRKELMGQWRKLKGTAEQAPNQVQAFQEVGGLTGRLLMALAATYVLSCRRQLLLFQLPGLLLLPWIFAGPGVSDLGLFRWGMFFAGLVTVAQFNFFGNYLPRMYPLHLRGTGEGFAVNFGGRVMASFAFLVTPWLAAAMPEKRLATAAAIVAGVVYLAAFVLHFFLPEPLHETLPE